MREVDWRDEGRAQGPTKASIVLVQWEGSEGME